MNEFARTDFVEWAVEREAVRVRREVRKLPRNEWSHDPVFQKYRFCNVSREDDKGTREVKRLIRDPMTSADAPPDEVCKAIAVARFFNWPDTLQELVSKGAITDKVCELELVFKVATERQNRGDTLFSTAYMVGCPPGQLTEPWIDIPGKVAYVCSIVKRAWLGGAFSGKTATREEFVKRLTRSVGFKDFMAGQVAADLYYTHVGAHWTDTMTWAPMGPGAIRGINRCMGRPLDAKMDERLYLEMGRRALEMLPTVIRDIPHLTLHDVNSNMFCETDKMIRIRENPHRRVGRFFK